MPESLTVVTPWYPSADKPFRGSFVQAQVRAVLPISGRVDVLATEDWIAPRGPLVRAAQRRHFRDIAAASLRPTRQADGTWQTTVPVLVQPRRPWDDYARTVARNVRSALGGRRLSTPVVHGHVGLPGGLVAVESAGSDARIVVTEHASFLGTILEQPGARALYDETMARADAWVCVSGLVRRQLVEAFPHHASKLHVVGNPVNFDSIPVRESKPERPRRWIYIGSFSQNKRPLTLVSAFARCHEKEPDLELTLLGDGAQRDELRALISELGLEEAVHIHAPVPPSEVPALITAHDLLVHPSVRETFGMTPVEALATGTPVLVARYEAADEVLADVDKLAGGLFDIEPGADAIVEGYQDLLRRWDSVDPFAARDVVEARYGYPAIAEQLESLYVGRQPAAEASRPEEPTAAPGESTTERIRMTSANPEVPVESSAPGTAGHVGARHALVVSVTVRRRQGVIEDIRTILDSGARVTFLCMRASEWPELDGLVQFVEIEGAEASHPVLRLERGVTVRLPNLFLRYVAAAGRRVARLPGGATPAHVAVEGAKEARLHYMRLARAYHGRIFMRGYRAVRPWVVWRSTRGLIPAVDLASVDLVLLSDAQAVSIGWHLARQRPDVPVAFTLDRTLLATAE